MTHHSSCFRRALVGYFTGPEKVVRRSLSTRLLEWVFSERGRKQSKALCCDGCHQEGIKRHGHLAFVKKVLATKE